VACLLSDEIYAPSEFDIVYTYDGCSFCAKHVKQIIQSQSEHRITLPGVILRP
jgi:predicted DCC family thiol-disulfide oxidoreductase YuxK